MSTTEKTERIYCNQCRGKTIHRLIATAVDRGSDEESGFAWYATFDMLQCAGCREVVMRRIFNFSEDPEASVQFFPPPMSRYLPEWRYYIPRDMRALLEEIYRSLDASNVRLPMMGARALLDMLLVEKVGDVGGFRQKLKALERAGFISKENRKVLSAALDAGSAAAHRGHAAAEDEVQSVMDIVENVLQAMYTFPDIAKKLRKSTPPRQPVSPPASAAPSPKQGTTSQKAKSKRK